MIPQLTYQHHGGMLAFGPDGYLYISVGDSDEGNDPNDIAQNLDDLRGKLLRIDVDNTNGVTPDGVPADNPFIGANPGRDEIYAVGFRNPWRFSFDRGTGDLYLGDVGQEHNEEIDIVNRVSSIYTGMLRRAAEQSGFDFWLDQINHGVSGLQLIQGFLSSTEYRSRFLP